MTIAQGDAEVALRTFPRRWRALLGPLDGDDPDLEVLLHHRGPGGASALECAGQAAAALELGDRRIRRAVTHDRPVLEVEAAVAPPASLAAVLARIDAAAPALATTVSRLASGDLDREAVRGASTVRVRTLLTETVESVAALLREADRALAQARASLR
jgi:hypothetical protein